MARLTKFGVAALGLALALSGCGSNNAPASPSTTGTSATAGTTATGGATTGAALTTITAGKLTLCSDSPYPPFEFEDSSSPLGYSGFDVDIMTAIAQKLGLSVVFKDTDFNTLQSGAALAAGQCDVGASALTITDERKANLDFSDGYYDSLQSLLVPADSGVKTLADLAGKRIGV
ncbi:MAG: ABC transporter substrate-binding protein, partial [Propionibacteriaceae bacterium]|nr:ABC transporter substrate-binding protein [Propionibacteriaceae bacterium]